MQATHRLAVGQLFGCCWLIGLGGCACGNFGFIMAKHTVTSTAEVVDIYSIGAQARSIGYDRGCTLGYRRTTYVFPGGNERSRQSSHIDILHTTLPATDPILRATTALGLELEITPEINRVAAGYVCQLLTVAPLERNGSCIVKLSYNSSAPELTTAEVAFQDTTRPNPYE